MNIRKFEAYEEFAHEDFRDFTYTLANRIEEQLNKLANSEEKEDREFYARDVQETTVTLLEQVYKEGYLDGYRFCDWLHENTL
ncbi:MAG: hypothetical protein II354_05510 [Firmicutes bacterium]|nr:hypothetical protein [Bacillota bacterium]